MSKQLQGRDGPVFGISNSLDLFQKLKHDSSNLCKEWNNYDAFNFFVTSWHLFHDWPKSDPSGASSRKKRNKKNLPKSMVLVLDVVRDLTNGSKHFQLDLVSANKRRIETVHTGNEVGFYEYFFHEDLPAVTVDLNWYFSVRVLHNIIMSYFDWVFNDTVATENFPSAILDAILYCDIANRRGGPSPEIWLRNI